MANYSPPRDSGVALDYDLPPAVKSLQEGWMTTCTSSATSSALFAAVESQLLVYIKGLPDQTQATGLGQALLLSTYCAIFLSISATVSSLILIDEFVEIPVRASRTKALPTSEEEFLGSNTTLLRRFQARKSWRWVMWHWLISLLFGYACLVVQLILQIWLLESKMLSAIITCVAVISVLPLIDFFVPYRGTRPERQLGVIIG